MSKAKKAKARMQIQAVLRNDPDRKPKTYRTFAEKYADYLNSPWWQYRRRIKLRQAGGKCERCGNQARDVHHKSYKNLGMEKDADLEALCRDCHDAEHSKRPHSP